jgi:predicted metalloprotease with PDZ domain
MPRVRSAASTTLLLLAALAPSAAAQAKVEYELAFPNAAHHEAEVTATFSGVPAGRPLEVRMSRSSPGRYALHEFAKNVYSVSAADGQGRALAVTRPNPHQWDVAAGHDGTVTFRYTLYGDRADGTYNGIDESHAHLNAPATFAWARGLGAAPVTVRIRPASASRKVATQLVPTADSMVFTAPNLQYLLDSPIEVSAFSLRSWPVTVNGQTSTIRLAVHHAGTEAEVDEYAEMAKQVVAEQIAMWRELPLDFGSYTFLADYLPYTPGDGMEHRNSTVLTSTRPLSTGAKANLGTLSHEFFHLWNVERLRPRSLEPFDYERENMSPDLWFAEGFTQYYTPLFVRRAGVTTDAEYAQALGAVVNAVVNAPGRRYFSAPEMSMQAPFVDAAVANDPNNRGNTFLSYYTWGSGIGLGLDLTLRERSKGRTSLDDYMRAMWREYGRYQSADLAPERTYTIDDLERVLGEVAGDAGFARDFFARYIRGRDAVDYTALLGRAGFLVQPADPGRIWLGAPLAEQDGRVVLAGASTVGSPLYRAGLDRGDAILKLGGISVRTPAEVEAVLASRKPGETIEIEWEGRAGARRGTLMLVADPRLEVVTYESAGRPLTREMRALRAAWLGSQAAASGGRG